MSQDKIIRDLAKKYDLSVKQVEEAVYSQFKFTTQVMKKGEFESVRLPYFGKFHVNPGRLKYLSK
jgi:nucleoid DNA-binding protein